MKKKVRYALAAAGVAPAVGLAMPVTATAATTAHADKTVKTVSHRIDTCTGNDLASFRSNSLEASFYWAPHNADICIGTIYVNMRPGFMAYVGGHVQTVNGNFCGFHGAGEDHATGHCHAPFTKRGLKVWADYSSINYIDSPWPFRDPS